MSSAGSITPWIGGLKDGDSAAVRALWHRFYPELVQLARQRFRGAHYGLADEEDVALSALDSFCRAAAEGRFPDLADRHDLWRLLLRMTAQKAVDLHRHELRKRRGEGRVLGSPALEDPRGQSDAALLAQAVGTSPSPAFAAMIAEQCELLLNGLNDAQLQALAIAKMQGYSNEDIAEQLQCSVRTVERRLQLIRQKWQREETS